MGLTVFYGIIPVIFALIFMLVFGVIIASGVRGFIQWGKNNRSPVLTVEARVVSKRMNVSHHHNNTVGNGLMHTTTSTAYYATFEFESRDRLEFVISGSDYGLLAEGDTGRLTFQGTRYKKFERIL